MDLLSILPHISSKPYAHILSSLERNCISTVDLVTLDPLEIAKRARVPLADVHQLCTRVIETLHHDVGLEKQQQHTYSGDGLLTSSSDGEGGILQPGPLTRLDLQQWNVISTLSPEVDAVLGGGLPTGYLVEVTGERSASNPNPLEWININGLIEWNPAARAKHNSYSPCSYRSNCPGPRV